MIRRNSLLIIIVLGSSEASNGMTGPSAISRCGGICRDGIRLAHNHALNLHLVIGNQILNWYRIVATTGIYKRITDIRRLFIIRHIRKRACDDSLYTHQ